MQFDDNLIDALRSSGLWERYDALELATPAAFARDPSLVWGWYEWRRAQVRRAQPNAAHQAIARFAQRVPRLSVITQNVDDLHERAGSEHVAHLHGRLASSACSACGRPQPGVAPPDDLPEGALRGPAATLLPALLDAVQRASRHRLG